MSDTQNQSGPDKDEHYVPSAPPTPITLRNAPPKAKRLKKGAVIAVSSVAALVAGAALYSALQPPKPKDDDKKAQQTSSAITPDTINGLATNYSQVPADVPKLGQPRPGEFAQTQLDYERQHGMANGNNGQQDPYQQELDKLRAEELERAAKARTSSLFAKTDGGGAPTQSGATDPMQQWLASQRAGSQGDSSLAMARSARDADNRQDDKQAFLAQDRSAQLDTKVSLPQPLLSPYTIKAGTPIPGALVTGINSDLPGKIVGRVTEPVYDTVTGHYLLIPQGATIMADYDSVITYGQSRVQAVTVSVSLPDGATVPLGKMAFVDQQGYAGLTGSVDNHWDRIGAVAGITGAFAFLTNWAAGGGNGGYGYLSPKQAAAQAAADQLSQAGSQIMQKQLQIQPTITVAPGSRFNILLSQDVIVKPYRTGP